MNQWKALYSRVARMVDWEHRQTEDEDMLYLLLERFSWRCCYFSSVWATHIELGETLPFSRPRNGWYHICLQGWRRPTHNHWQPKQVDVIRRIGLADQDKVTKKIRIRSGQTLTNAFKRSQLITAACLFVCFYQEYGLLSGFNVIFRYYWQEMLSAVEQV